MKRTILATALVFLAGCGKDEPKPKAGGVDVQAPGVHVKTGPGGVDIQTPGAKVKAGD